MPPHRDLSGEVFGNLTVLRWEWVPARDKNLWLCECSCRNRRHVLTYDLTSGKVTSCGCKAARRVADAKTIDRTGDKYGLLTVVARAPDRIAPSGKHWVRWQCRCDCGKRKVVRSSDLASGNTQTCGGKKHRKKPKVDLTGKVFGQLTVVELAEVDKPGSWWTCTCTCGATVTRSTPSLCSSGQIHRCGYKCPKYFGARRHIIGEKFGDLTVVAWDSKNKTRWGGYIYECLCACGTTVFRPRSSLTTGSTTSCGCRRRAKVGQKHHDRADGGYMRIYQPDHPSAKKDGWMMEHRFVFSELLGRPLEQHEEIHHRNGVKDDNSVDGVLKADPLTGRLYSGNLELWSKSHPSGQRPGDKVTWAREIIALYGEWFPPQPSTS